MKHTSHNLFGSGREVVFGLIVMIAFLLPHTSMALMLANPILCLALFFTRPNDLKIFNPVFIPIVAIVEAIVFNLGRVSDFKAVLTAVTIILYFVTFPLVSNIKLKNIYIYLIFFIIFLTQVGYMLDLGFITSFVDRYYPISWNEAGIENMINTIDVNNYRSFRLGGLYRNPNHCAKYISLLLAIFFIQNKNKKTISLLVVAAIALFAVSLTGSRTGFLVSGLLIFFAVRGNTSNKTLKLFTELLLIVLFIYMLVSGSIGRGTAIGEGMNDSFGLKLKLTVNYILNEQSVIRLLFGNLDATLFQTDTLYSFDCDYGYFIYCFGFIGFFSIFYLLYRLFKKTAKKDRFFFLTCLWMLTSSMIMSYRTVFVFFLLLPLAIYQNNRLFDQ